MNTHPAIVVQWVALIASIIFVLIPLRSPGSRAGWANALFVIVGIVGILVSGTKLLLILHWIAPASDTAARIYQVRVLMCGFALGLILALILSRQLTGRKQIHETHAA
jgi:hypothetical protein